MAIVRVSTVIQQLQHPDLHSRLLKVCRLILDDLHSNSIGCARRRQLRALKNLTECALTQQATHKILTAIAAKQDIIDMHDQVRINIVPAVVARRNIGICERLAPPLLRECLLLRLAVLLLVRRAHVRRTIRVLRLGCHGLPRPLLLAVAGIGCHGVHDCRLTNDATCAVASSSLLGPPPGPDNHVHVTNSSVLSGRARLTRAWVPWQDIRTKYPQRMVFALLSVPQNGKKITLTCQAGRRSGMNGSS
mmetsp:Transcript_18996/g.57388  ORF Transcript_18996/g.57388 Transcript_18996/m.57388 type:complete len:248 (+) Transcript_18996:3041-3784(+)